MKVAIDLRLRKRTIKTNERLSRRGWWMRISIPSVLVVSLAPMLLSCGSSGHSSQDPQSAAQFGVEPEPQSPLVMPGNSLAIFIIAIPHLGSLWNGVIAVTVSGGTSGLTVTPASFSVDTTQGTGETVTLAADSSLAPGGYSFTVTGTSGTMSASAMLTVAVVQPPPPATQLQANVLYNFTPQDGKPAGPLIADSAGNLYGVAGEEVFKLSYSNGTWQETVLYTFPQVDTGPEPIGSLAMDASGNLYGVTAEGGSTNCGPPGCGMVYELTPTASGWQETVLHKFASGTDGSEPTEGLVVDKAGNLYGTTRYGGYVGNALCASTLGCGTVFTFSRSPSGWQYSVIYSFQGFTEGFTPDSTIIIDQQGNLYGTTEGEGYQSSGNGGNSTCHDGCGTVFKLTKTASGWQETTIYSFDGLGTDGADPTGVVMDSGGNLYGTTSIGGFYNGACPTTSGGNFFELSPVNGGWTFSNLYFFLGCNFGYSPLDVIRDQSGDFYGVAGGGPAACDFNLGCGVVFQLSQPAQGWIESAYYDFPSSGADGWSPSAVTWVGGKLYGTTSQGGESNFGVIFEISP